MEKSGPGASKFQPGQRVVAAGWAAGTWQDYIVQPEKSLVGTPAWCMPQTTVHEAPLRRQHGGSTASPSVHSLKHSAAMMHVCCAAVHGVCSTSRGG